MGASNRGGMIDLLSSRFTFGLTQFYVPYFGKISDTLKNLNIKFRELGMTQVNSTGRPGFGSPATSNQLANCP